MNDERDEQVVYDFDKLADAIEGIRDNKEALETVYQTESEKELKHLDHLRAAAEILEQHGEYEKVKAVFDRLGVSRHKGLNSGGKN